jgi:hypothetical protein
LVRFRRERHKQGDVVTSQQDPEVRAANITRSATIRASLIVGLISLIVGLIGIVGILVSGYLSYRVSSKQIQTESERSSSEFLRNQRQTSYSAFANQMTVTMEKLSAFTGLFQPGQVPPTSEQFDKADGEYGDNAHKLGESAFAINLIATDPVRKCASAANHFFLAFEHRLYAAGTLFKGTSFEELSKTVPITPQENGKFAELINGFSYAARDDLGVGNSGSEPKGSCD